MAVEKYPTPNKPGFYWAKWKIKEPGTTDEFDKPSDIWEVVEVFENGGDSEDPEYYMVFVGGVQKPQNIANFYWGYEIEPHWSPKKGK